MNILERLLAAVTGNVGAEAVDYFKQRQALNYQLKLAKLQGEIDYEKANTAAWLQTAQHDADWELAQIKNSGWKDEYVLVLLSIPLVLVFIPYTQPYVLAGFAALEQCPGWFQLLLCSVFAATYGIRWWRRPGTEAPPRREAQTASAADDVVAR